MISLSPLRYPGGKSRFTTFIWDSMIQSGEKTKLFVEPFCGGSAVSISLLNSFKVQQIALNDSDPLVANFWKSFSAKGGSGYDDFQWLLKQSAKIHR
jgi:DNA adenine methylase